MKATWLVVLAAVGALSACGADTSAPAGEFHGTKTEYLHAVVGCMKSHDTNAFVHVSNQGSEIGYGKIDATAAQAAGRALTVCEKSLPRQPEPNNEREVRTWYQHRLAEHDCLVKAGFKPAPPPPETSAIRSGMAGNPPEFKTYGSIINAPNKTADNRASQKRANVKIDRAFKACPVDPNAWY